MSAPDFTPKLRTAIKVCLQDLFSQTKDGSLTSELWREVANAHGFDHRYLGFVLLPELRLIQTAERVL